MSSNRLRVMLVSLLAVFAVSAVVSASASAVNLQWEVCEKGGTEKWSEHKCNAGKGTGEWSWKKLEAGDARTVSSLGKIQKLIGKIGGEAIEIECTEVEDGGAIEGGKPGKGKGEIIYHGCAVKAIAGCAAKSPGKISGVISLTVKTTLVEISAGVEGDKFEPTTPPVFVEIELGKTEEAATHKYKEKCGVIPLAAQKVEGSTIGKAETGIGGNLCEKLAFTKPAQTGSSLKFAGEEAIYEGVVNFELQNLWAFRCS